MQGQPAPKKRHLVRNIGIGLGSVVALLIVVGIIGAIVSPTHHSERAGHLTGDQCGADQHCDDIFGGEVERASDKDNASEDDTRTEGDPDRPAEGDDTPDHTCPGDPAADHTVTDPAANHACPHRVPVTRAPTAVTHAPVVRTVNGMAMPNPALTADATFAGVTAAQIYGPGWSSAHRGVTQTERYDMFVAYGIPYAQHSDYELDHLIALELGGDNEESNLWPEPQAENDSAGPTRMPSKTICTLLSATGSSASRRRSTRSRPTGWRRGTGTRRSTRHRQLRR